MTNPRGRKNYKKRKSRPIIDGKRECLTCGQTKPIEEFGRDARIKSGYRHECKECIGNPDRMRRIYVMARYGLTPEQYDDIASRQRGLCEICGRPETATAVAKHGIANLSIDHDHRTGKVRGLLCRKCNTALGFLEEDADLLLKMRDYILTHREVPR